MVGYMPFGTVTFSRSDFDTVSGLAQTLQSVSATLNNGGPMIDLLTQNGLITVAHRSRQPLDVSTVISKPDNCTEKDSWFALAVANAGTGKLRWSIAAYRYPCRKARWFPQVVLMRRLRIHFSTPTMK